jgi:cytoskeletal protein CcmA (bactofilin family)
METQADTIIGADVHVKGNLKNKGSIQINGTVDGEVKSDENVTIGESSTVTGPINAQNILVSGKIIGTVESKEKLEIDPTGTIEGEIKTKILIVREGAKFNGNCLMADEKKTLTEIKTQGLKEDDSNKEEKKEKGSFWDKAKK